VTELEQMRDEAAAAQVAVLMGYNKNVCKYVRRARDYAAEHGGDVTFVSNNTYTPEGLAECFERNAEGMLKNMAIHELALLVSFYDVTVETIAECVADKEFSSCQTLIGPSSGQEFTDFDKIRFTITTTSGKKVSVQADRCGGDTSYAKVEDAAVEVFRHSMPDEDDKANVTVLEQEYPGAMVRGSTDVGTFLWICDYSHNFQSRTFSAKTQIILLSRSGWPTFAPMECRPKA
jgi:predicted dehydrogenase